MNVEDEEELIGVVTAIISGPDRTVWMADRQLSQVYVYSAAGEYLRTLSGEGDGPGEVRDPEGLLWLPDGSLGIIDRKPGRITRIDVEGVPLSSLQLQLANGEPMASADVGEAQCRAGTQAVSGTEFRFDTGAPTQSRFLGIYDARGAEVSRLMEAPSGFDFEARTYDEIKDYFVSQGRWLVDALGRVHLVPQRNRYMIHVHDSQGRLVLVYEREYELWRRTGKEKDEAGGGATMMINGEVVEIGTTVDDYAPAIRRLEAAADGSVWVLSSRGTREQPEGIARSYDVFDSDGRFREIVRVAVDMDDDRDRLLRLADDRWILLHNISGALRSMYAAFQNSDSEEAPEEDGVLEIICLAGVQE